MSISPTVAGRPPQSRGHEQLPSLVCFDVNHFKQNVPLTDHWVQHERPLQYHSDLGRRSGQHSHGLPTFGEERVPKPACKKGAFYQFDHGSAPDHRWSWHELVAQLDDESLLKVVEGNDRSHGLVACMVRESARADRRRRPKDENAKRDGQGTTLLYHWEVAFLRADGTVAFLKPESNIT